MNCNNIVKSIRAKTDLSQQAFSDKYGIPKRTIENWESGVRKPPQYIVDLLDFAISNGYKDNLTTP